MTFGVVGNRFNRSLAGAVEELLRSCAKYNIECFFHSDLAKCLTEEHSDAFRSLQFLPGDTLVEESDTIVAFGGDGTILSAARMVGRSEIPILGVNLGKLGFMAEASLNELDLFVHDVVNGLHVIEERMLLKTTIEKGKDELISLNEVVIDNGSSSRLIHISVYVDDDYLISYSGDGIILATPTGSTAYSLAAGGPIVAPTTDVILIQPISPHSLSARTVIVPKTGMIRIVVEHLSNESRITADGQVERIVTPPTNVFVSAADHVVKLVKRSDRSYYDVLRAKLFWGSDVRLIKGTPDE